MGYSKFFSPGYINQPDLTAERFIEDPNNPGWRWLRTGDIGKLNEDGELVVLGRKDNMVKIRGIRIELSTIENKILSYPGVVNVASKVIEDENGGKRLATYFTAEAGVTIPISDLRRALTEKIPVQHLPNYFIQLEKFPQTASGKVSIKDLPTPSLNRPTLANPYIATKTDTQKKLCAIWEDVIGINGIGIRDDFFDLGGDSLIGVLMFLEIEKIFGVQLPVSTLLKANTVEQLAEMIKNKEADNFIQPYIQFHKGGDLPPIFFIPGRGGYPTRIMHLQEMLDPHHPVYALQDLRLVKGDLDDHPLLDASLYFYNVIQTLEPGKKIILLGESLGGKVAYEIARMMIEHGYPSPDIFLLDTYCGYPKGIPTDHSDFSRKGVGYSLEIAQKHISIVSNANPQGIADYLKFYFGLTVSKISRLFSAPSRNPTAIVDMYSPNKIAPSMDEVLQMMMYQPKPIHAKVVLFKALRGSIDVGPSNGWNEVGLSDLVIEDLDCYHGSILFEPTVTMLANKIKEYLP